MNSELSNNESLMFSVAQQNQLCSSHSECSFSSCCNEGACYILESKWCAQVNDLDIGNVCTNNKQCKSTCCNSSDKVCVLSNQTAANCLLNDIHDDDTLTTNIILAVSLLLLVIFLTACFLIKYRMNKNRRKKYKKAYL